MNRRIILILAAIVLTAGFFAGVWLLLNPANPVTRIFQAKISDTEAHTIVGPYPSKEDLKLLKEHQVGLIVSLLDARLPYEKILLERETREAAGLGLALTNFPMSSVLGQRFGDSYDKNAGAAAATIAAQKSKVYLHCYLGVHRAKVVQDLLSAKNISAAKYNIRQSERTDAARQLDQAEALFRAGKFKETIEALDKIQTPSAAVQILYGWAYSKSGDNTSAKTHFLEASQFEPENSEILVGLAFCALKDGDLNSAEESLNKIAAANRKGEFLLASGILRYRQSRLTEARTNLEAFLKEDPTNTEAEQILGALSQTPAK